MLDWRVTAGLVAALAVLAVFGLLWLGWRAKARSQAEVAAPARLDGVDFGPVEAAWDDVHYVATTPPDAPLERIVVHGLGFRGRCRLELGEAGLAVRLAGGEPFLIPIDSIESVERGTATIDRVVERGGLSVIRWRLGEPASRPTLADTSFRIVDAAQRDDFHRRVEQRLARTSS